MENLFTPVNLCDGFSSGFGARWQRLSPSCTFQTPFGEILTEIALLCCFFRSGVCSGVLTPDVRISRVSMVMRGMKLCGQVRGFQTVLLIPLAHLATLHMVRRRLKPQEPGMPECVNCFPHGLGNSQPLAIVL